MYQEYEIKLTEIYVTTKDEWNVPRHQKKAYTPVHPINQLSK